MKHVRVLEVLAVLISLAALAISYMSYRHALQREEEIALGWVFEFELNDGNLVVSGKGVDSRDTFQFERILIGFAHKDDWYDRPDSGWLLLRAPTIDHSGPVPVATFKNIREQICLNPSAREYCEREEYVVKLVEVQYSTSGILRTHLVYAKGGI